MTKASNSEEFVTVKTREFNDQNVGRVKAHVIGVRKDVGKPDEGSAKALVDPWGGVTQGHDIIPPPFDLLGLSMLGELNGEVSVCVEAMERNTVGYGWRLKRYSDVNIETTESEEFKAEVEAEHELFEEFVSYADYDMKSFVDLRSRTRRDLEYTGNAYWEVIRDDSGNVSAFNHVPSWMMRLRRKVKSPVIVEQNRPTGRGEKRGFKTALVRRHFRTFVQARTGGATNGEPSLVFFKEYGDPRQFHRQTGMLLTEKHKATFLGNNKGLTDFPDSALANEIIHFKLYSPRSPYGLPRFIGVLLSIYGARAAEEINYITFKNNNVPSMVLLVSNGMLSGDSIGRITEFVETSIQGSDNRSKFLVLEAESFVDDENGDPGNVKLDIKPLTKEQHNDELFQNYQSNNEKRIRRSFRLPPILTGAADDYTRATAETSRRLADEQVFDPERREDDHLINRVLRDMGIKYHEFVTNTPNVTNDGDLIEVLKGAEKSGGVTPRIARVILEDILGRDLGPFPEGIDPDVPFTLTVAEAVKNRGDAQAQVTSFKAVDEEGKEPALVDQIIASAREGKSKGVVLDCGSQSLELVDGDASSYVHPIALGLEGRTFFVGDGFEIVGTVRFGASKRVDIEEAAGLAGVSHEEAKAMFPGSREVWATPVTDQFKFDEGYEYTQPVGSQFAYAPDDMPNVARG